MSTISDENATNAVRAIGALDFYQAFTIDAATGEVAEHRRAPYSEVDYYEGDLTVPAPWKAVPGLSCQYGYSGPIMHASEQVSLGIVRQLVEQYPGAQYVLRPVFDSAIDDDGDDLVGWIILANVDYADAPETAGE